MFRQYGVRANGDLYVRDDVEAPQRRPTLLELFRWIKTQWDVQEAENGPKPAPANRSTDEDLSKYGYQEIWSSENHENE